MASGLQQRCLPSLAGLVLLLAVLGPAAGQEPKPSLLILKLGWAPEYCTANAKRTAPFCGGTQPSGAFRVNRLYGADASGKDLAGCKGAAFSAGKVPDDLRPQLECVWPSYAAPGNNEELWSSIWSEANEGGLCTGLAQGQWMRLALSLRDRYNPDVALSGSSLGSGTASGAGISREVAAAYGKQPHIACTDGAPKALSSLSLCFQPGSFALVDCPAAWESDCQGPLAVTPGPLPSAACARYYPGVTELRPAAAVAPSPSLAPQPSVAQPSPSPAQPASAQPSPSPAQPLVAQPSTSPAQSSAAQPSPVAAALPSPPASPVQLSPSSSPSPSPSPSPSSSPSPSPLPALPPPLPPSPAAGSSPAAAAPSQTEAGVAGSPVSSSSGGGSSDSSTSSGSSGSSGGGGMSTGAGVGMAVGIAAAIVGAAGAGAYLYLRKPGAAAAAEAVGSDKLGDKPVDPEAGSEAGTSGRCSSEERVPGRSSSWSPGHTYTASYRYT